jgi:hypothetical protein
MLANDVEWQVWFQEFAEQVAKLSKPRRLDTESITEVKTRIASYPSTTLLVREKNMEATPPVLSPSRLAGGHCIRDPSLSPPPEINEEEERQSPPLRHQQHDTPEYSEDSRPELEVKES